jgi:hypothetical protein
MDPSFPKDIDLADSLDGTTFVIVSDAVRSFLDSAAVPQIETLPIKIIDHKGRVASDAYYILNPLAAVDCIDEDASAVELDLLDPGTFSGCEQLALRGSEVYPPRRRNKISLIGSSVRSRADNRFAMKSLRH